MAPDESSTGSTPRGIDWNHASDFEVLFRKPPQVVGSDQDSLLGSMRRLSQATVVESQQRNGPVSSGCFCHELLPTMIEHTRKIGPMFGINRGLQIQLTLSEFLGESPQCAACTSMRRVARIEIGADFDSSNPNDTTLREKVALRLQNGSLNLIVDSSMYRLGTFLPIIDDRAKPASSLPWVVRFLRDDPSVVASSQQILSWLHDCQTHERCQNHDRQSDLPSRILDVGTMSSPSIRLHVSSLGEKAKYITLSYCWGGYTGLMLKSSNIERFQSGIDHDSMPQTYKDAIKLTRLLGIRYIWIDALCILQDSKADWELESPKMHEIYGGAYLTISASVASTATQGFLSRRESENIDCVLMGTASHGEESYPIYLAEPSFILPYEIRAELAKEPLSSRAWAQQERILSDHIVHFTSKGMLWECKDRVVTEAGTINITEPRHVGAILEPGHAHVEWYEIIEEYSKCLVTKLQDRLPALTGIMRASELATGTQYLFGHPKADLLSSLLWTSREERHDQLYLAPSWSWASSKGHAMWRSFNLESDNEAQIIAYPREEQVRDISEVPDGGRITLWARCVDATLRVLANTNDDFIKCTIRGRPNESVMLGVDLASDPPAVTTDKEVVLVILHAPKGKYVHRGLILESTDVGKNDLRRCGTWASQPWSPIKAWPLIEELASGRQLSII